MRARISDYFRNNLLFIAWVALLLIGIAAGLIAAFQVFSKGLVVTNLTDLVPWGLWITVDLSSIALSGGAFFLSALVYIVGIKRFKPIARLAVFIGLLGYSAAMCTLLLDIGRPDRFWHAIAFWNTHSMLWEVSMCIFLYFNVLLLEVFPLVTTHRFFDRLPRIRAFANFIHKGAPILAFFGLALSLMHQSSLGGTYGVIIARPIWFRPTMPLMFIASAIAAGPALTMSVALLVGWLKGYDIVPRAVIFDVARITGAIVLITLYIRFWDIWAGNYGYVPLRSEATATLTSGLLSMNFWSWEIMLGGLIPSFLLLWSAHSKSEAGVFVGGGLVVAGLIINRWNTTLVGLLSPLTVHPALTYPVVPTYSPALVEWGTVVGILAGVLLAFTIGIRTLQVFGPEQPAAPAAGD